MKGEIIWNLCPDCKKRRKHEVIEEVSKIRDNYLNDEQDEYGYIDNENAQECEVFQIVECRGCETVSYRQFIIKKDGTLSDEKIYPIRDLSNIEIRDFGPKIPHKIKVLYFEVIQTFNSKLGVLCAAGIRAIIEGICNEKKINGGSVIKYDKKTNMPKVNEDGSIKIEYSSNLDGKIEGLAEHGFITKNYAATLHNLRFLGNQAVHQLDKPSEDNLKLAIDIVEHTLKSIYEIEEKALQLNLSNIEPLESESL